MRKRLLAGAVLVPVIAASISGLLAASANAAALPQQKVAAQQSVASATVLGKGAQPQMLHDIAGDMVAAMAGAASKDLYDASKKIVTKTKTITTRTRSSSESSESSSSESSSSSSGGPVTNSAALHGVIPGDVQFNVTN
ncbi:hypothetical protein AB0L75_38515 [Streptomyces sp. NPDC052101]|uniref:hypothetical protein n=1 Tax=Streptomyces sp. NPDC052101 TaxID=3155763 RepID=UPI003439CFF8